MKRSTDEQFTLVLTTSFLCYLNRQFRDRMISKHEKPVEGRRITIVILFAASCFLVYLLSNARPDVFFSGDGGLKFLVLKQVLQNGRFFSIEPHRQQWVNVVWSQGYFPLKPPFVYHLAGSEVVSFPPFFQWLNAPLYNTLGYSGLYVIPALSLFILWCWFIACMRRWNIKPVIAGLALLALVFGSPLTLYAAMYWEHTLSLLLSFSGIVFLVSESSSRTRSLLLGFLTGCSGLLRPELIVLSIFFIGAALVSKRFNKNHGAVLFGISAGAVILVYFGFNLIFYGTALGAHGIQLIEEVDISDRLTRGLVLLLHLNAKFIAFFPVSLLYYAFLFHLVLRRPGLSPAVYQLAVISILYALLVPFLVPNGGGKQWSPRYFLPLIPLIVVTLCLGAGYVNLLIQQHKWLKLVFWILLIPGFYLNTITGSSTLAQDYRNRVTPAMNLLKDEPGEVIIVQNQYITQEFAALFRKKTFFLAESQTARRTLLNKLKTVGVRKVIYISPAQEDPGLANELNPGKSSLIQFGNYFLGKYSLVE